jgi:hypothetical protein
MKNRIIALAATAAFSIAVAQAQPSPGPWGAFHGNAQRTGHTTLVGPSNPVVAWTLDLKGPMISSPIVAPDGTIYTGAVWSETRNPEAFIWAIHPDGTVKWKYPLPFVDHQTVSSPALDSAGNLYVGLADGKFISLSPAGALRWQYQAEKPVETHPAIGQNGNVYVVLDGKLTAFTPAGSILWQFDLQFNGMVTTPAIDRIDGTIYCTKWVGNGDVNIHIMAIRPDGTLKWDSGDYSGGGGSVAQAPNGDLISAGYNYVIRDRETGAAKSFIYGPWDWETFQTPAIDPQNNTYLTYRWGIAKFNSTGVMQWHKEWNVNGSLGRSVSSFLVDGEGKIFVGMGHSKRASIPIEKTFRVYDSNGNLLKSIDMPETMLSTSAGIGPDGTIYIGCLDGKLYAFKQGNNRPADNGKGRK